MSESDAPQWLIDLITNQSRLMSASPKSIADSVWHTFTKKEPVAEVDDRVTLYLCSSCGERIGVSYGQ